MPSVDPAGSGEGVPSGDAAGSGEGGGAWPTEIKVHRADRRLDVLYDGGETLSLDAEYLRVESPSAEVRGHGAEDKQIVPGKRGVGIEAVEPVGNYAIRIRFSDGHDTGLYSWDYLRRLSAERESRWADYLSALETRGLSRD